VPPPSPIDQIRHPVVIDTGLTPVGEDGPPPSIGLVRIEDLPAGETVVLAHLLMEPLGTFPFDAQFDVGLDIAASQGVIHVDDCVIRGADLFTYPGLRVTGSHQVTLSRSTVTGGSGSGDFGSSTPGAPGMELVDSGAAVLHSTITGGLGGTMFFHPPGTPDGSRGGPGMVVTDSELRVLGSTLQGGPPSPDCSSLCASAGLELQGPSVVRSVGSTWLADGAGPDLVNPDGTVIPFPDTAPELSGPPTLTPSDRGTLTMRGAPGDTIEDLLRPRPGLRGTQWQEGRLRRGLALRGARRPGPPPGIG